MRFFLIDHSLRDAGGHHYDYAALILRAAAAAGYETVVATGRQFHEPSRFPAAAKVFPLFRHHAYSNYCAHGGWTGGALGLDGEPLDDSSKGASPPELDRYFRARRLRGFASSCRQLFKAEPLGDGDQVFLPTVSDFDLLGLVRYLSTHPETAVADWHLQFHFNILDGREPEYRRQAMQLLPLRQQFQAALDHVPKHRLHFYTTTEQLARQYNTLGVVDFSPLVYPINEDFHQSDKLKNPPRTPLRVTSAGAFRPEKGQHAISDLVSALWDDYFSPGKLQMAIQCKPGRISTRPRHVVVHKAISQSRRQFRSPGDVCWDPVMHIRHPLAPAEYLELIHEADIGLLMYDARRYYSRHAGVLGEYLSAAVPVIVPAACWLSDQIDLEIQSHREALQQYSETSLAPTLLGTASGQRPPEVRGTFTDVSTLRRSWSVAGAASDLLLRFRFHQPAIPGTYIRVTAKQLDAVGQTLSTAQAIARHRLDGSLTHVLFHLAANSVSLQLEWSNAFDCLPITISNVSLHGLPGDRVPGGQFPSGRVGLVAATPEDVPELLVDMHRHYDHYRRSSSHFSEHWSENHRPGRTVQTLLANSDRSRKSYRAMSA